MAGNGAGLTRNGSRLISDREDLEQDVELGGEVLVVELVDLGVGPAAPFRAGRFQGLDDLPFVAEGAAADRLEGGDLAGGEVAGLELGDLGREERGVEDLGGSQQGRLLLAGQRHALLDGVAQFHRREEPGARQAVQVADGNSLPLDPLDDPGGQLVMNFAVDLLVEDVLQDEQRQDQFTDFWLLETATWN